MKERLWNMKVADVVEDIQRVMALAHHLDNYEFGNVDRMVNNNYLVYTDNEADHAVREYIEGMTWAFSTSFLQAHTGVDSEAILTKQAVGEGANDSIKAMIKDFDAFVDAAVSNDGRGPFLSPYDGNEITVKVDRTVYYIYRIG